MSWLLRSLTVLAISLLIAPHPVRAISSSVTISEVQTGSASSASHEFVELYNQSASDVSLDGWYLDYKSSSGSSWSHKVTLSGVIAAQGFYLLTSSINLLAGDQTFAAGLSASGGHIRLTDGTGAVVDLVGWGSALSAEGSNPAPAPAAGQSIERLPGRLNDLGGNGVDSDNNGADFIVRLAPEPQSKLSAAEAPDLSITSEAPADDAELEPITYLPIMITELLVDPASPKSDSRDEFIELYNPNDQDVNLAGYTLRVGSGFRDYYILPAYTLAAHSYTIYYSRSSSLGLTNSGGAAQLLDPAGVVVSQTDAYGAAKSDHIWAYFDGGWRWTLAATPGGENILDEPAIVAAVAKSSAVKSKSTTKSSAGKAPKSTTKPKKETKKTAKKTAKPKVALASAGSRIPAPSNGAWLIIGLAGLTIGYAIYEYRADLQNRIHLARRKLSAWRANRPRTPRR